MKPFFFISDTRNEAINSKGDQKDQNEGDYDNQPLLLEDNGAPHKSPY